MNNPLKKTFQKTGKAGNLYQFLSLLILIFLIYYFWNHLILYPFKLLVVFFHEASHALATILTGGRVEDLVVVPQQGGYVISRGGNRFIILNSGYLGSLTWGILIFAVSLRGKSGKFFIIVLALLIGIITLAFTGNLFAILFGIVLAILMFISGFYFPEGFNAFLLRLIGLTSMVYVPLDILSDTIYRSHLMSDARMLAEQFGGFTLLWGGIWLLLSGIIIVYSVYRLVLRDSFAKIKS